jgi:hypothetical protein
LVTCPICKGGAVEIDPGLFDGISYRCEKHGDFSVSGSTLSAKICMDADETKWENAFEKARKRAIKGKRPVILTYDF